MKRITPSPNMINTSSVELVTQDEIKTETNKIQRATDGPVWTQHHEFESEVHQLILEDNPSSGDIEKQKQFNKGTPALDTDRTTNRRKILKGQTTDFE